MLTTLAAQANPTNPAYLARKAWTRKRRLPQKERFVRAALRRLKRLGLVIWEYDSQWECWGWFCSDAGREVAGY